MTDKEKLEKIKKLADAMYYAAGNLGPNVGSGERLRKTMEDYHKFIIHEFNEEEPTISDIVDEHFWEMLGEDPLSGDLNTEIQRYLRDVHDKDTTVGDVARHFAAWQKQLLMAKAVDGKIYETQARSKLKAVTTGNLSRLDYKVGDKVKVIIIKEG